MSISYSLYRSTAIPIATGIRMPAGSARARLHGPGATRVAISETMVNGSTARNHLSCWRLTRSARRQRSVTLAAAAARGDHAAHDGQDLKCLEQPIEPGDGVRVGPVVEQAAQVLRDEGVAGDSQRDESQRRPQRGTPPRRQQPALGEDQQQDQAAQAGGWRVRPRVRSTASRSRTAANRASAPGCTARTRRAPGDRVGQPDQAQQRTHRMTRPPGQQHAPHPRVCKRVRHQE